MYPIKQSTTAQPLVFLMVQSSDHITGLTGASPTVTIRKVGGSFATPSGSVTEIANGWYQVAGNATDTNTLGPLLLHATAASGDPTDVCYHVVAYDPQDAVRLGLSSLPNASAGANTGLPVVGTQVPNATAGAANGLLISGTNTGPMSVSGGVTFTGAAAAGSTPATPALTLTGGAASTTAGGTSAAGVAITGGAGAASTNGAAAGQTVAAGGTTTVSGNDGVVMTGTGNGNGLTLTHAGTGKDLNATTSGPLQTNATQINSVSAASVTTISANLGTTQPVNFTGTGASALAKSDAIDINSVAASSVTTIAANLGTTQPVNFTGTGAGALVQGDMQDIKGSASVGAAGFVGIDWAHVNAPTTALDLSGTTISGTDNAVATTSNIKKNSAVSNFMFVMTDSTTHAPKTGLTVSPTRSLDGAAFAACANAVAEISSGWYQINLAATDTNANRLALRFTATGADDLDIAIITQP